MLAPPPPPRSPSPRSLPGRARTPVVRAALTLLLAALTLAPAACNRDPESVRWVRGEAVGRLVAELLQQKDSVNSVNLADLAPYRWDSLYIFPPRTSAAAVGSAMGIEWEGAERSGIAQVDTAALLVFTQGGEVVAATMHPREYGDFVPSATVVGSGAIPSDRARFDVVRPSGGGRLMYRAGTAPADSSDHDENP